MNAKERVDAEPHPAEANSEIDAEPNASPRDKTPEARSIGEQSALPLFLRDKSEGNRGSAQDEKDETGE
jgi:hypothetical protein